MNGLHAAAVGRPGRDGELKYTPSGTALLTFPLAVEVAKKSDGDETQWLRVSVWGERAEALADQVKNDGLGYVEGRARVRTWTNQAGETKADLELSAWRCEPLFQIGRSRHAQAASSVGTVQPGRPMLEAFAIHGQQPTRRATAVLDQDDGALDDLSF